MKKDKDEKSVKQNPYFRKDDEGRDVYYPWGYAGDCYYVTEVQKRKLKSSFNFAILFCVVGCFLLPIITPHLAIYCVAIVVFHATLLLWVAFFYCYSKKLEPSNAHNQIFERDHSKPKLFKDMIASLIFYLGLVLLGILGMPDDLSLLLCGIFIGIFYPSLIYFVWRRRGYIFQEKPS
ncbi:MAG: hypothetical protein H6867_10880 [Rhodospirillales bacterium]|nr:hypothetical protein [Rhodospirillales bacterium]MCB9996632.1 hypothetical protein [Rhodospirillales bacterium]